MSLCYIHLFSVLVAISITGNCSEHYDIVSNLIKFDFQPSNSEPNRKCFLRITSPEDRSVLIKFESLEIPATQDCRDASLQLHDGLDTTAPKIGDKLCGNTLKPDVESSGNNLLIQIELNKAENVAKFDIRYETTSKLEAICYQ